MCPNRVLNLPGLCRCPFCSGSWRVNFVWCIWIIRLQQDGQQSRCPTAAAAAPAAAEHTYLKLNLQQLVVLTDPPPPRPPLFLKKSRYAKKSQKISLIFYITYAKKRRPINCTERHKLKVASLEVHYLRFSLTNSPPLFCVAKNNFRQKKTKQITTHTHTRIHPRAHQCPHRKPVYAKQVCMHNL